jgi:hypothetical protein
MEEEEVLKIRPLKKGINDSDPNDLDLRIFSIAGEEVDYDNLPQTINVTIANNIVGVVNFNTVNNILFTPSITGTITFPYVIKNTNDLSATANQIIEVIPLPEGANDPEAVNDYYTMEEGEVLKLRPLKKGINDSDPNDLDLSIIKIGNEEITGSAQTISVNNGVVSIDENNIIVFTPNPVFFGTLSFPYTIANSNNLTDVGLTTIIVDKNNDSSSAPRATDDLYNIQKNETVKLNPLETGTSDSTPDGSEIVLTFINGEEVLEENREIEVPNGKVVINDIDDINFIPNTDFIGDVVFSYEISNYNGETDTGVQQINVVDNNALSLNEYLNNDFTLYPNPAKDKLSIKIDSEINLIEIYTLLGKKVLQSKAQQEIDISQLSNAVYFIKVYTQKGAGIKKFIKI